MHYFNILENNGEFFFFISEPVQVVEHGENLPKEGESTAIKV
jgi:hypothetical protein